MTPRATTITIPDAAIADLRARLAATRFEDVAPTVDEGYGSTQAGLREAVAAWSGAFDWRALEAQLNAFPQVLTEVTGTRGFGQPTERADAGADPLTATVHAFHVRSPEPHATPAILTHGWPGTACEFLEVIGPLTDPRAHGGDPATALHLVVPSLPGFAFSGPTREPGWGPARIASAWVDLMGQLGYERFVALGNDWGSVVTCILAQQHGDRVMGAHVTQIFESTDGLGELSDRDAAEEEAWRGEQWFQENLSAYHHVQAQQPASLAHALADSPAGLLGWMRLLAAGLRLDDQLAHASSIWLTGTVASSLRTYREDLLEQRAGRAVALPPSDVPLAYSGFAFDSVAVRRLADRLHRNIVQWRTHDVGSHWAASSAPEVWLADVRDLVATVRGA